MTEDSYEYPLFLQVNAGIILRLGYGRVLLNPFQFIICLLILSRNLDSAVGIAICYWLDDREVRVRVSEGARIFFMSSRPVLEPTQPPIQWVLGALSPGVKRTEHEADYSPPTSIEVKKTWMYTSTSPYAFMA
jgi:hypothetical protein